MISPDVLKAMPKAELHCHLEGTLTPSVAQKLAARHNMDISHVIGPDGKYSWRTFAEFLNVYDVVAETVRTPDDYYDITCAYYDAAIAQGLVYGEMFISADHPLKVGLSYDSFIDAIDRAADHILAVHGVEIRFVLHVVRHYGVDAAEAIAKIAESNPKTRVTGIGIAGDEDHLDHAAFSRVFERARGAGLRATAHAGEHLGADSVRHAVRSLGTERIGHGVRAFEDLDVVTELTDKNITLEVCPSSNVCLGVNTDLAAHPIGALHRAGVKVTINTDDPPHFFTDIGSEYEKVAIHQDMDATDLLSTTRNAITAAFCEPDVKANLLKRIDDWQKETGL